MADYAQSLNKDTVNNLFTSARWDSDNSKWMNDSALWHLNAAGILVPTGVVNPLPVSVSGSIAGTKEMLTVADTAVGLTAATYGTKTKALIQVQDAPIRYWQTNDAPTSTAGILAQIGDVIYLDTASDIAHFKAIRTTATSANLACQYSS